MTTRQIEHPQLFTQRHYVDIDEWGSEVGWDFDYRQIEAGPVSASARAFGTSGCIVTRGEFSRRCLQSGTPPPGMLTFGFPDPAIPEFRWCSTDVAGGDIINFSLDAGFEGVMPSMFSGFAMSFREELLLEAAERHAYPGNPLDGLRECGSWRTGEKATRAMREQVFGLLRDFRALASQESLDFFDYAAADLMLQIITPQAAQAAQAGPGDSSLRRRATRVAVEWMEQHDQLPVTVAELCRVAGVSAPTLYRGFEEEFGLGPKRYIQIRRLGGARKELLRGARNQRITAIATRWGFWHLGQFSIDYRRQFGESPSETRKRALTSEGS